MDHAGPQAGTAGNLIETGAMERPRPFPPSIERRIAGSLAPPVCLVISLAALLAFAWGVEPCAAHDGEHWPTPYTAEQIRDAWYEGFWLETEIVTAEGSSFERTVVTAHSPGQVTLRVTVFDGAHQPLGEPVDVVATWEELRLHAEFPRARADRTRHRAETPLGPVEGYLYRVDGERDGEVREYFFSRDHPGPPVQYRTIRDGEVLFAAGQVARAER